jgi:hypothetical protein
VDPDDPSELSEDDPSVAVAVAAVEPVLDSVISSEVDPVVESPVEVPSAGPVGDVMESPPVVLAEFCPVVELASESVAPSKAAA